MAGKEQQPQEEIGDDEDFQMVDNASSFKNDKCPYTLKDVSVRGGGCIMSSGMGRLQRGGGETCVCDHVECRVHMLSVAIQCGGCAMHVCIVLHPLGTHASALSRIPYGSAQRTCLALGARTRSLHHK